MPSDVTILPAVPLLRLTRSLAGITAYDATMLQCYDAEGRQPRARRQRNYWSIWPGRVCRNTGGLLERGCRIPPCASCRQAVSTCIRVQCRVVRRLRL